MPKVVVAPQQFHLVDYDPAVITAVAEKLAGEIGLTADVTLQVDESTPFGRGTIESLDPPVVKIEGGAFENPKRPKALSEHSVVETLGRVLHQLKDRLDPAFGAPPVGEAVDQMHQTAWDAYAMGRTARLGYEISRPRRQYHFRNRHGFTDVADAAFDRLWQGTGLTWADVEAACAETAASPAGAVPLA
ncbi:MAG TPA: hypothetical protein VM030_03240 [Acidimicrobiales bacterium]|nr:hypothetical protein [Acidimicrobiales bacterium]